MNASPATISYFLPEADQSRGPFGLLGIQPHECDDFALAVALSKRLRKLEANPECNTPAANEVRQTLYTAVAQLRDPELRAGLAKQWYGPSYQPPPLPAMRSVAPPPVVEDAGDVKPSELRSIDDQALIDQLPPAVRAADPTSRLTLIMLAAAVLFACVIGWLMIERPWRPPPATLAGAVSSEEGAAASPPSVASNTAGAPPSPVKGSQPEIAQAPLPIPAPASSDASPLEASSAPALDPGEARRLLEQLRAFADASTPARGTDLDLLRVLDATAKRWPDLRPDLIEPICLAISENIFRAGLSDPRRAVAIYDHIAAAALPLARNSKLNSPGELVPAVWSAGILSRLRADTSIPGRIVSSAREALAAMTTDGEVPRDTSFVTGALLALDAQARRSARPESAPPPSNPADPKDSKKAPDAAPSPDVPPDTDPRVKLWESFTRCSLALEPLKKGAALAALGSALSNVLRDGDVGVNPVSDLVLATLLAGVPSWHEKAAATQLLSFFDDPRISTRAMQALTTWMAGKGPLASVGPSMVLSGDATSLKRSEMRDAYALHLGVSAQSTSGELARRWLDASRTAVAPGSDAERGGAGVTVLAMAVGVARLNECAARRWAMDEPAAEAALAASSLDAVNNATTTATQSNAPRIDLVRLTAPGSGGDGAWAARFIGASRNEATQQALLAQLRAKGGPVGPADCDVLASAACSNPYSAVRQLAAAMVKENASRIEMINGLLEAAPEASRRAQVSELIQLITDSSLPKPSDPAWKSAVRKALVSKLILAAASDDSLRLDALGSALADSTSAWADAMNPPTLAPATDTRNVPLRTATLDAADEAVRLRASLLRDAKKIPAGAWAFASLDDIEQRQAGRERLARGAAQRFVAAEHGVVELLAYLAAAERPADVPRLRAVLDGLGSDLRQARTVFHQCLLVERAALRVWIIRFGEQEAKPSEQASK